MRQDQHIMHPASFCSLNKKLDEGKEEIVSFLHNVYPVKKRSKTSYFDMSIQTANGTLQ